MASKHDGDFYFRTEIKFKSHEKLCENEGFCKTVMPSEKDNIIEFN